MKFDEGNLFINNQEIGLVKDINVNIKSENWTEQLISQMIEKQNELFAQQISIVENKDLTQKDILLLDRNDFKAIIYEDDPRWTHYYYKGKRILSLGPTRFEESKQVEDGFSCTAIQEYY